MGTRPLKVKVRGAPTQFAPQKDTVVVELDEDPPSDMKLVSLTFLVVNRRGQLVYREMWPASAIPTKDASTTAKNQSVGPPGDFSWNGIDNQAPRPKDAKGQEKDVYVTPLDSPYTFRVVAELEKGAEPEDVPDELSHDDEVQSCNDERQPSQELVEEERKAPILVELRVQCASGASTSYTARSAMESRLPRGPEGRFSLALGHDRDVRATWVIKDKDTAETLTGTLELRAPRHPGRGDAHGRERGHASLPGRQRPAQQRQPALHQDLDRVGGRSRAPRAGRDGRAEWSQRAGHGREREQHRRVGHPRRAQHERASHLRHPGRRVLHEPRRRVLPGVRPRGLPPPCPAPAAASGWLGERGPRRLGARAPATAPESFERAKAHYDATRADRATKGLDAALQAGDNAIPWLKSVAGNGALADVAVGDDLDGVNLRTYVDTIGFDADYLDSDEIPLRDQHVVGKEHLLKHNVEARRLNRPTVPLEATLHLKDVSGAKATVPEAVGPVRIDWVIEDVAEDLTLLYADDPGTSGASSSYIQKAHTDLAQPNCPRSCGGIAEAGVGSALSAAWLGQHYAPYEAEAGVGGVFSRAYAERIHDRALGKAGLLLRPSLIAGDTYRVTARVRFTGADAGALDTDNGAIEVVTGTIQNWRRAVLASYLPWPARLGAKQIQAADWQRVQEELAKAYVFFDIDPNAIPTDTPTAILDPAKYKAWIEDALFYVGGNDKKTDGQKTGAALAAYFGVSTVVADATPVTLVHNTSQASIIKDIVSFGLFGGKSASAFPSAPRKELYVGSKQFIDMVVDSVRATKARGFIVGDVDGFVSITAQYPTLPAQNLFCVGMRDLACFIDHNADYPRGFMLTHEMAHCLWLRHSERAGEPVLEDHDRDDHYCMMSYPEQSNTAPNHLQQANFDPHFCGKCNFKLRGWNVRANGVRNGSG